MRVLVIEDDHSIRETLGLVLETYQHEVFLLSSGESALEFLKSTWPDVMLLDLTLQGISGEEVYRSIREQFGSVPPTVVLSAVQHGEDRVREMPGVRFLAKPYSLEELIQAVTDAAATGKEAA